MTELQKELNELTETVAQLSTTATQLSKDIIAATRRLRGITSNDVPTSVKDWDTLVMIASDVFSLPITAVYSRRKPHPVGVFRAAIQYIASTELGMHDDDIARIMGVTRTATYYARKKCQGLMETDPKFIARITTIQARLKGNIKGNNL